MPSFDDFRNKWIGQRVDYDHVLGWQCVDLIRQYIYECYGITGGGGVPSAINYWTTTPQALLTKFNQVSNNEAQKGDIVILWGLPGNTDGHIGIATGGITATTLEILEQNGSTGNGSGTGGDAIRTRWVARPRVAGLLRPVAAPVAPTITVTPFATPQKFTVTGHPKYNLDLATFNDIANNPLFIADSTVITVTAYLTRSDLPQYVYYLENGDIHHGYNKVDCTPYIEPTPYVPPAPPKEAPLAEKYTLLLPCMAFDTAVNAKHHRGVATTLVAGEYYVIAKDSVNNAYNLSDNNMKDRSQWVNLNDNRLEEVAPTLPVDPPKVITEPVDVPVVTVPPATSRIVTRSLRPDGEPVYFKANNPNPIEITDLSGNIDGQTPPFFIPAYNDNYPVPIVQTFTVDNVEYGRTKKVAKAGYFYGIRMQWLREIEAAATTPVHAPQTPRLTSRLDRNGDGKVNIMDITDGIQDFIDYNGKRLYTQTIKTGQTLAVVGEKAKKFVDGYKAKRKVQ